MRVGTTAIAAQVLAALFTSPRKRGEVCISVQLPSILFRKNFFQAGLRQSQPGGTCKTFSSYLCSSKLKEADMGFGRGALLWLIGIPLPIILILALFMHH
jgi:hypothetical protein